MAANVQAFRHDPRAVSITLFDLAKTSWWRSLLCKAAIFVVGTVAIVLAPAVHFAPIVALVLTTMAEWFSWQSNQLKGVAEAFLRKVDVFDSFGWPISPTEMSDLLTRIPVPIRQRLSTQPARNDYFASTEGVGPKRAIENIQESAWWSKHLSGRMSQYCFWATTLVAFISVIVLIVSAQNVTSFSTLSTIGRMVTNTIMFIFSFGLLRLTLDYYAFSKKAESIEKQSIGLLANGNYDLVQTIKLYNEYHLARASAPLIPTQVWKLMQNELNDLWDDYRK